MKPKIFTLPLALLFLAQVILLEAQETTQSYELYTDTFSMERIYRSMQGPDQTKYFRLFESEAPELIWFTGARVEVLEPQSHNVSSPEYMCHQQLYLDLRTYGERRFKEFGNVTRRDILLLTLAQGQFEMKLPANFGIPLNSSERVWSDSMAMNPKETQEPVEVRFKTTFNFLRDQELKQKMKPLYLLLAGVRVPLGVEHVDHAHGELLESASRTIQKNKDGHFESGHWYVPPGRHTYRYNLKKEIAEGLPFDTTVHFIGVHMHPYGEVLELRDLTTEETIFKSEGKNFSDVEALESLDYFSSEEGIAMYRDHDYELVTVYNNTTDRNVDVMAVMYLYLLDKTFDAKQAKLNLGMKK